MGMFSDISKALDKVWHEKLIPKLSRNSILILYQNSSWNGVTSGVLQGSILGPLLFLMYINDLSDGFSSNCKLFADDTSIFSVVHDVTISSFELNSDSAKITEWAFKWKMSFNLDPTKPAQEVIFSRNLKTVPNPSITFNNNPFPANISTSVQRCF